jgi:cation:H+ antiporter
MDLTLLLNFGLLAAGIVLLVLSGDYLVKGSVAIAHRFKISSLVIGLTVVAFGTSAPELIVSLDAAITGHPEMALGNVIGSNIANIALVLGLTVAILPMPVSEQTIKRSWPIMLLSGAVLFISMIDGKVTRGEGILMFIMLLMFIVSSIKSSKRFPPKVKVPHIGNKNRTWVYFVMVTLAAAGLAVGSRFLVTGASALAAVAGISERVISITIVAFGTSLPELTASVVAAFKKETDISVGNIIGSNIFNVFAVIGITAGVNPIFFSFSEFSIDLWFMLAVYVLLFIFMLPFKSILKPAVSLKNIQGGLIMRAAGNILFVLYLGYIVVLFKA